MNVEIGAEAAQFPEKEYINGIAVAVGYMEKSATVKSQLPKVLGFIKMTFVNTIGVPDSWVCP
jgi:hypothetical protein